MALTPGRTDSFTSSRHDKNTHGTIYNLPKLHAGKVEIGRRPKQPNGRAQNAALWSERPQTTFLGLLFNQSAAGFLEWISVTFTPFPKDVCLGFFSSFTFLPKVILGNPEWHCAFLQVDSDAGQSCLTFSRLQPWARDFGKEHAALAPGLQVFYGRHLNFYFTATPQFPKGFHLS